jgi:hypothetical protein
VAVTTLSHGSVALDEAIRQVQPARLLREGGCGYKALMVAQGEADVYLYPQPGTKVLPKLSFLLRLLFTCEGSTKEMGHLRSRGYSAFDGRTHDRP